MKGFFAYFFTIISVVYVPALFVLALIPRSSVGAASYALNLLFFFMYSFPFYCVTLEVGATIKSVSDSALGHRKTTAAEKVMHALRWVLSAGILATLIDITAYIYPALVMAAVWVVLAVICAVVFRESRPRDGVVRTKKFWILAAAVFLALCCALFILRAALDSKNRPDTLTEVMMVGEASDFCSIA